MHHWNCGRRGAGRTGGGGKRRGWVFGGRGCRYGGGLGGHAVLFFIRHYRKSQLESLSGSFEGSNSSIYSDSLSFFLSLSLSFFSLSLSFSHNLGRTYKRSVTEVLILFKILFIGLRFVRQAYVHSLKKRKEK